MMAANDTQVGGDHYKSSIQHWDYVVANDLDYFQGQITKYVTRWKKKNGVKDLLKARHFLDKYIELQQAAEAERASNPYTERPCVKPPNGPPKLLFNDKEPVAVRSCGCSVYDLDGQSVTVFCPDHMTPPVTCGERSEA